MIPLDFSELDQEQRERAIEMLAAKLVAGQLRSPRQFDPFGLIRSVDWQRPPIEPREFLESPEFMGKYIAEIYPKWIEELSYVLDAKNHVHEWIITGAIGLGKSVVASIALTYKLCNLLALRDPVRFYGLMSDTEIVLGIYSLFKYKAADDNFGRFQTFCNNIPYIRDRHPFTKRGANLQFPKRIRVIAGSNELHALGNNLFGMLMDEVNFMRQKKSTSKGGGEIESQAQNLYTASVRRLKSRFQRGSTVPGLFILLSSRNAASSWLEVHTREVQDTPGVHVSDFAVWDVKPGNYSPRRFFVQVGDRTRATKILASIEEADPDATVISVPENFRTDFERDIDGAVRDLGGKPNQDQSPFFRFPERFAQTWNPELFHPFTKPWFSIGTQDDSQYAEFHESAKVVRYERSLPRPRLNPSHPRHLHFDLSKNGDATGLAMAHLRWDLNGRRKVVFDFMLRVVPPLVGDIAYDKIYEFVLYLRDQCGYRIDLVTCDQYQSLHLLQRLASAGIRTETLSLDAKPDAYHNLRDLINDGEVEMYNYAPLFDELSSLERDARSGKIDHPPGGSKDVADAVAGVCFSLIRDKAGDSPLSDASRPRVVGPTFASRM